jgi:cyanophycinase
VVVIAGTKTPDNHHMNRPRGYLVAIGGAENKGFKNEELEDSRLNTFEMGVLGKIIRLVEEGEEPKIEIITSASHKPLDMYEMYKEAFGKLGCTHISHLNISDRNEAELPENLNRLVNCNCLMFSGGDQLRLSSIFGGTEFLEILKERYQNEHFIVAGTSAGAMTMSNTMIYGGSPALAHLKGEVKMSTGFGLLQNVIIDTHFDKRGRFNRLTQSIAAQPGIIGIGLGEDTGIIVSQGEHLKAIGSGSITIIDGKNIRYNNIGDIKEGSAISVENIRVHIMANGDVYNLRVRSFEGNTMKS